MSDSEKCQHERTRVSYDHVTCLDCYSVRTDSCWGIAANTWFPSLPVARFYREHGRMPEPPK